MQEIEWSRAAWMGSAAEQNMNYGCASDLGVGLENGGAVVGDPAFRCGLPLRGGGWFTRNAGPRASAATVTVGRTVIGIAWPRDVAWRKRIRFSKR